MSEKPHEKFSSDFENSHEKVIFSWESHEILMRKQKLTRIFVREGRHVFLEGFALTLLSGIKLETLECHVLSPDKVALKTVKNFLQVCSVLRLLEREAFVELQHLQPNHCYHRCFLRLDWEIIQSCQDTVRLKKLTPAFPLLRCVLQFQRMWRVAHATQAVVTHRRIWRVSGLCWWVHNVKSPKKESHSFWTSLPSEQRIHDPASDTMLKGFIPDPQVNNAPTSIWPHTFHKRLIISGIFFIISPLKDLEFSKSSIWKRKK